MTRLHLTTTTLICGAFAAQAGGIDRSGQDVTFLFEEGRKVELAFGYVAPEVSGEDVAMFGGGSSGDVAENYWQTSLAFKTDVNDRISLGLILDQPYGADVEYDDTSIALGQTSAEAKSMALTALGRFRIDENFSVHGGIRAQRASANIRLQGAAYGPVSGYEVDLDDDVAFGYLIGAAYEIPELAFRVALTFASEITHEFDTVEDGPLITVPTGQPAPAPPTVDLPLLDGTSETEVDTPASVNLDFQTGIAEDTLLFGSIRWADYSELRFDPVNFVTVTGEGLIELDDSWTYSLGLGYRFTDAFSGSVSVTYEPEKDDDLVSPLAPTNGRLGLSLAGIYAFDNFEITTGINYTRLGDARPETGTPDEARAEFDDNYSVGLGLRVAYTF